METRYISIYRYQRNEGEPYQVYAEVDDRRRATRKIALFPGGRSERVSVDQPNPRLELDRTPVAEFVGEVSIAGKFMEEIAREWFEELWEEAGLGSIAFLDSDDELGPREA